MIYVGKRAMDMGKGTGKGEREIQFLYRITGEGSLMQSGARISEGMRGGQILGVEGLVYEGGGGGSALMGQLLGQLNRFGYGGICCVFPVESRGFYGGLVKELDGICEKRGLDLLVMEGYGQEVRFGKVLVSSAVSGGTLEGRFRQVMDLYGGGRVVMDLECMREDFLLPCPLGVGERLGEEALRALMERCAARVFGSVELCGQYFTYEKEGALHLVLFDDRGTMEEKCRLAKEWGLGGVYMSYGEGMGWGFL